MMIRSRIQVTILIPMLAVACGAKVSDERHGVGDSGSGTITTPGTPSSSDSAADSGDVPSSAEDGEAATDADDAGLGSGISSGSCPTAWIGAETCPGLPSGIDPSPTATRSASTIVVIHIRTGDSRSEVRGSGFGEARPESHTTSHTRRWT